MPVYIFAGGNDKVCPLKGDQLLEEFKYPQPPLVVYEGWQHYDFVKGAELDRLVSDIYKVTIGKRQKERAGRAKDFAE